MQFLANTGFLFGSIPVVDKVFAAASVGFDGVEFHDEVQHSDPARVADALAQTGLQVGSLNTRMGATVGCAALPEHEAQFAQDMRTAHAAACTVGATAIHALAGCGGGTTGVYVANLRHALDLTDRMILIEPISTHAIPGYFLSTLPDALAICDQIGDPRLRIMFDWFHMAGPMGADAAADALQHHREWIGHVQLASIPTRAEPDADLIALVGGLGVRRVGLEYRPTQPEGQTLARLRAPVQTP